MVRDIIAVSGGSLMAITVFASAYYLAAHLVFPRDPIAQAQFDAHFFRVRHIVLGTMFALLLCQLAWYASEPALQHYLERPLSLVLTVVLAALMLAAMAVRGERLVRVVMVLLVARYLVVYQL